MLYIWGIRHPASGYVQGINDLTTPFYVVFAGAACGYQVMEAESSDMLSEEQLKHLEADVFWCLSKLLDGIQDHYTFAQPGIQRKVFKIQELVSRIDSKLYAQFQTQEVQFIQFAFRWINCLLLRELSLPLIVRCQFSEILLFYLCFVHVTFFLLGLHVLIAVVWDTYFCEGGTSGFQNFHVYVCAALLVHWSPQLQNMNFSEMVMFLQHLPTEKWEVKDVETLLSQAFVYKTLYDGSPAHLQ